MKPTRTPFVSIACLGMLAAAPTAAQEPAGEPVPATAPEAAPEPASNPFSPRVDLLRLFVDGVYDDNIDHEPLAVESFGFVGGLQIRIESHPRTPRAWLAYEGGYQSFSNSTRWDRWQSAAELGARVPLRGPATLEGSAAYDGRVSTEDRELVNQFTFTPELRLDWDRWGLRGYGAWRTRRYTDTAAYDEDIWMAAGELRLEPWHDTMWRLLYRHEDATSDTPSRSYVRNRYRFTHETEFGRRNAFLLGAEYQDRTYADELVDVGTGLESREDRRWVLRAGWEHTLPNRQDIRLLYEYEERTSNDPGEEYAANRVELRMRWPILR